LWIDGRMAKKKNAVAVALGRLSGLKGGEARGMRVLVAAVAVWRGVGK
jgi:hypothetical protein